MSNRQPLVDAGRVAGLGRRRRPFRPLAGEDAAKYLADLFLLRINRNESPKVSQVRIVLKPIYSDERRI